MAIELNFDLPYSLDVDGSFTVLTPDGQDFQVTLVTHVEPAPQFPGAESVENIAITEDDSNIISHTKVTAQYTPADMSAIDPSRYSGDVAQIALAIANILVTGARLAHGAYIKDYLYSASRLGPVKFTVSASAGNKGFAGFYDPLMGGIMPRPLPRSGPAASAFAAVVASGKPLPVSQELYFDARRYLIQKNLRMALANLVISFEVDLADQLTKIAAARGDAALETSISEATLGTLGTSLAKLVFGASFEKEAFWGAAFSETYVWLRDIRNKVLHKAIMAVSKNGRTRDFADEKELSQLFSEHDQMKSKVEGAVSNVLAGKPANP